MAIDRHSSWQNIRLWKQGWTIAINQMNGGIWWQRLNECKRHQSASDYCNCHQIPPRPLTGHADPLAPPTHTYQRHQHSSTLHTTGALPGTPMNGSGHTHTNTHTHTLSLVLLHLLKILLRFFFPCEWNVLHTEGLDTLSLTASSKGYFWQKRVIYVCGP